MTTNPTTARSTRKKVTVVVGAVAIIIALTALLGEWGWGEKSQAESASVAAMVAAPETSATPAGASVTVSAPNADAARPSAVAPAGDADAAAAPVATPSSSPAPATPAAPASSPVPSVDATSTPSTTVPAVGGGDDDESAHESHDRQHGVDDHAVDHSDQHDESEAVAHGRDDVAHQNH